MKTTKTALAIVVVLGIILTSCYWRNLDTIHTVGSSSTSTTTCTVVADSILNTTTGLNVYRPDTVVGNGTLMSYSIDIKPIIGAKCGTSSACHGSGASGLNPDYSTWAGLYPNFKHDTTNSIAWSCIAHGTPYVMPIAGNAALSTCEMDKIRNWIHQGAQNN